jgi:hypothetical protein
MLEGAAMFEACHAEAAHAIALPLDADACFPLFTPIGEIEWVADWQPRFLFPADGKTRPGMVFATGQGEAETLWTVVDYDEARHYARYSRVTPGSRCVLVEILCTALAARETRVEVRYALTGLSAAGNAAIGAFVGDAYIAMIEEWRRLILSALAARERRASDRSDAHT